MDKEELVAHSPKPKHDERSNWWAWAVVAAAIVGVIAIFIFIPGSANKEGGTQGSAPVASGPKSSK